MSSPFFTLGRIDIRLKGEEMAIFISFERSDEGIKYRRNSFGSSFFYIFILSDGNVIMCFCFFMA